jgi:hypothetical protein
MKRPVVSRRTLWRHTSGPLTQAISFKTIGQISASIGRRGTVAAQILGTLNLNGFFTCVA